MNFNMTDVRNEKHTHNVFYNVLTVCKSLLEIISVKNPTRINIGKRLNQARSIPSMSPGVNRTHLGVSVEGAGPNSRVAAIE